MIENTEPTAPADDGDSSDVVDGLSPVQAKAVLALLNEPTILKAAHVAGVSVRTMHTWLDEDERFVAAYRKARRQTFTQAISLTMRYAPMAINVLAKVMVDTQAPYPSRVAAAANLLKFGRESVELDDLAVRLDTLERMQNVQPPRLALRGATVHEA